MGTPNHPEALRDARHGWFETKGTQDPYPLLLIPEDKEFFHQSSVNTVKTLSGIASTHQSSIDTT